MKYQLAVFDSDGTLADTLPWMRSAFNELAEEFGFRKVEPGDELRDAEAAHAAKVAFGAVLWGQHDAATLRAADPAEIFSSVADIAHKLIPLDAPPSA